MYVENIEALIKKREHLIIIILCIIAACRIFVFNAAFPFFNNIDEGQHFDLICKYSQGYLPNSGIEHYSRESAELIVLYASPEYLSKPEMFPDSSFPPPRWRYQNVREPVQFDDIVSKLEQMKNHETGSFPVYYTMAGFWYNIGKGIGMEGGDLLYWLRFLNIPLFVALILFSYMLSRLLFPDDMLHRVGLPFLLSFFPLDVFYSINSDVLSPLLFAISSFQLLKIYYEDKSYYYHLFSGLIIAATLLTKPTNVTFLFLFFVMILLKVKILLKENQFKKNLPRLVILVAMAGIPVCIWLGRNYFVLGDLSGSADKIRFLGWTIKPLGELWDHPIFTAQGFYSFLTELIKRFWRGEFLWHFDRIASVGSDLFYVFSTSVFILASGLGLVISKGKMNPRQGFALTISLCLLVISVLLLAILSTFYDFHDCWNPSRDKPYFVSGRLISGALLPFLIVYLDGIGRVFYCIKEYVNPLVIVMLIVIAITFFEISLSAEVFSSQYNWFHL